MVQDGIEDDAVGAGRPDQTQAANVTQGFVHTHGLGICRGRYAKTLVKEWHRWDKLHESENDAVDAFPADQLYVVFVFADGGADLEHFKLRSFEEAQSILLQVGGFQNLGFGTSPLSCDQTYAGPVITSHCKRHARVLKGDASQQQP